MGMYDTVLVPCPNCKELLGFQSKVGECLLMEYTLEGCPENVLSDVNRHSPNECESCGTKFAVELREVTKVTGRVVRLS